MKIDDFGVKLGANPVICYPFVSKPFQPVVQSGVTGNPEAGARDHVGAFFAFFLIREGEEGHVGAGRPLVIGEIKMIGVQGVLVDRFLN